MYCSLIVKKDNIAVNSLLFMDAIHKNKEGSIMKKIQDCETHHYILNHHVYIYADIFEK